MGQYNLKPREKRLYEIIVGQGIVGLVIVIVSLWLIIWGVGYKINWQNLSIKHTGVVYLSYRPKDAESLISGQVKQSSSPNYAQVFPGYYDVSVSKSGYQPWISSVKVEADRVCSYKNIVLFKEKPEIQTVTDKDTISSIDAPFDSLVKNPQGDLVASTYEIWNGDELVTRFSKPISGVIWYPGNEYIGFQQADEIRIVEKNGTNDNLLIRLSSPKETKFIFSWDGHSLLYRDGDKYYKADIN